MLLITITLAENGIIKTIEDSNPDGADGYPYSSMKVYEDSSSNTFITEFLEDLGIPLNTLKFLNNSKISLDSLNGEIVRHEEYLKTLKKQAKLLENSGQVK